MGPERLKDAAETLLRMHTPGDPVILPTVWDAWSARLAVDAGFGALTVGSHPVADSIGRLADLDELEVVVIRSTAYDLINGEPVRASDD